MRTPDRLPDEALDDLLDGSPSEEALGTPLAAYLDAVRHDAVTTEPRPSAELGVVLAEGLDPAELEARDVLPTTAGAGAISWRRRGRLALRVVTAKFAALGILGKAAAAGAAVTVAASGAGAAGVLPPPAQTTFNEVVGREAPEDALDEADASSEDAETPPETPADTSDTAPLDSDLSDDATGRSDGEPGVDGGEVANDATERDGADAGDAEQRPDEPEDTPAGDRVDDTPADEVPEDAPPTPAPAEDRPAQDEADQGDVKQRPYEYPAVSPPDDPGRDD